MVRSPLRSGHKKTPTFPSDGGVSLAYLRLQTSSDRATPLTQLTHAIGFLCQGKVASD